MTSSQLLPPSSSPPLPRGGVGGEGGGTYHAKSFFERPEEFYSAQEARATAKWVREYLERQDRAMRREALGLSNLPYLAEDVSDVNFSVTLKPAGVDIRLRDRISRTLPPVTGDRFASRGVIKELSDRSRRRLQTRAYSLQAQGYKAQIMVTLTSPGNWESVYVVDEDGVLVNGGRLFKRHMEAFKKRLTRFLDRFPKLKSWKALWFLEFQERGAPHVHIMLFAVSISDEVRRALAKWAGGAWSEIVGNPDTREQAKHRRAGSQVAKMRTEHFGYAAKYASKAHQKNVPEEFQGVGRFWGNWNHQEPKGEDFCFPITQLSHLQQMMGGIFKALDQVSQFPYFYYRAQDSITRSFISYLHDTLDNPDAPVRIKNPVSFTIFGEKARLAFMQWLSE